MNAEEKVLIDVVLVALIAVIWVRWRREPNRDDGETC